MKEAPADKSESTYNHILKYTGLFGGVQGLSILLSVIRGKCVAVILGSVGMGLIDLYNRTIDFLSNSTNCGIGFSAVRKLSELYENGNSDELTDQIELVRSWSFLTAIGGIVLCLLFSPLISLAAFDSMEYTLSFCLLSPMVGFISITNGEMAILKGLRQLKKIALVSAFGAFTTLLFTVPLYLLFGIKGIVPALILSSFAFMLILIRFTSGILSWRMSFPSRKHFVQGKEMVRLGVFYVLAGIVGTGAEVFIRRILKANGSIDDVGLYAAGFTLSITYARLIFVAMDADYYPRLSASMCDKSKMNHTINSQIEVCVLLMAPFLIFFMFALPAIIHIIYTQEFLMAIPMILSASFYMFFKAITTPIAYSALAKGDSLIYFSMETIYYVFFIVLVSLGFTYYGLLGAGIALSVSNLVDFILITSVYSYHYGFRFSSSAIRIITIQFLLVAMALAIAFEDNLLMRIGIGSFIFLTSIIISICIFRKQTNLTASLKGFLRTRILSKQQNK